MSEVVKKTEAESLICALEEFQRKIDHEHKHPEEWTGQTEHEASLFIPRLLGSLRASVELSKQLRFNVEEATGYAPPNASDDALLEELYQAFNRMSESEAKSRAALGRIYSAIDGVRYP